MALTATLQWQSDIARGARRDATAAKDLAAALATLGNATGPVATGLDRLASSQAAMSVAAEQAKLAAIQEKAAAQQALQSQKSTAQQVAAAQKAAAQQALQAQKDATKQRLQDQKLEADSLQKKNDAIARLIQQQQKDNAKAELDEKRASRRAAEKEDNEKAKAAEKVRRDQEKIAKDEERDRKRQQKERERDAEHDRKEREKDIADREAHRQATNEGMRGDGSFSLAGVLGPEVGIIAQVLGMYEQIASAIAGVLEKFGGLAIKAVSFKETTSLAFEGLLHSEEKAKALYEKALDLSDAVGLDKADVVQKINKFLTAGFDEQGALAAVRAVADVSQVLGEAAGNRLSNTFTKIQAAGKLGVGDVKSLKAIGIESQAVYAELAKLMGKSAKEVEGLVKTGQVNAKTAEQAIENVVNKQMGGLAEKAGKTVPRLLGDIVDEFERLFDNINIDPFRNTLKGISDFLTGDLGKELKSGITELGSALFELLFGAFSDGDATKDIGQGITFFIKELAGMVKAVTPTVHAFIHGLEEGFGAVWPQIAGAAEVFSIMFSKLAGGTSIAQTFGKVLGFIAGALIVIVEVAAIVGGAIVALFDALANFGPGIGDSIVSGFSSLAGAATGIGDNLISSLTSGMYGALSGALDAAGDIAQQIINKVKGILGIHSPSKVFGEIGEYAVIGFSNAVNDNAGGAAQAAGDMARGAAAAAGGVAIPAFGPSGASAATRGGKASGGASGNTYNFTINVNGGGDGQGIAQLVRAEVEAVIRQYAEAA